MNKNVLNFLMIMMMPLAGITQQVTVSENLEKIADGINNALVVNIPEAGRNDVIGAWRKIMKGADAKVSGKSEMVADNARIPVISPDTVDIYTNFDQKEGYVKMTVAFKTAGGFISSSSSPSGYREAERIVRNFAVEQARAVVEARLGDDKSKLSKLEKKFKDLDEENNELSRDIESYTRKIQDAQKRIEDNTKSKDKLSKDIEDARKAVELTQKKLQDIR